MPAPALALGIAPAAALDKAAFAANWLAEAKHGGFYQAKAGGTHEKYGPGVTILQGPNANHRLLLAPGKAEAASTRGRGKPIEATPPGKRRKCALKSRAES